MSRCYCPSCRPIGFRRTYTEEYRHECEVQYVAAMKEAQRKEYLRRVAEVRGDRATTRILNDLKMSPSLD